MSSAVLSRTVSLGKLTLLALLLAGCAGTGTKMTHSWVDATQVQTTIKRVLVIGLAQDPAMRRTFETRMAGILEQKGVAAVPSFRVMPSLGMSSDEAVIRETVETGLVESGADAVTVTRLVSADTFERYVQGSTYTVPAPYYHGFHDYYYDSYQVVQEPGYVVQDKNYVIETNLYNVATGKLVWTGISETLNPDSAIEGLDSVGKVVVKTMEHEGLIAK